MFAGKISFASLAAIALVQTSAAQNAIYILRPAAGASIELEVYKTGLMAGRKHVFSLERYNGELSFDPQRPESAKLRLSMEANSAVCTDTWVNEGSRKKIQAAALTVMDAAKYPRMSFTSTRVVAASGDRYDVEGSLSIRDRSAPVTIHVVLTKGERLKIAGSGHVELTDFGLKPPAGVSLGLIGTKKEMTVRFVLFPEASLQ